MQTAARIDQARSVRRIGAVATPLPRNAEIADQLDLLADLSELLGEAGFRVLAYRRAATRVRDTPASVAQLALEGKAKELSGIGATIEQKIVEVVEDGEMHALTRRREQVPGDVPLFMRLPGLGPKTAARIWSELGITTLAELRAAAEAQRLRALTGLGAKTEEKVLKALDEGMGEREPARGLLGAGLPVVRELQEQLQAHPAVDRVSDAGSIRRRRETFRDLDLIATASDPAALTAYFVGLPAVHEVLAHGDTKATIVTAQGFRVDLRVVPPESYGNLLQHFTGAKDHNVALREDAVRRGLSVSEYGVTEVESGEVHTFTEEADLYAFLGYGFIPPELRENAGELEAAREGRLPELVELGDLTGDLHSHTTWSSDGKSTMEEMALAAIERGYEYLAITDHSHYLREARLEQQAAELHELQERLAPFRLLHGIEVNIRADASLDVDDETLAGLDWVIASVHHAQERSPMERILAAMDNPNVDAIGHLTGRRIGRRPGADLDLERIIGRAIETSTVLEINSQPDRLDLRDSHARLAGESGARIAVNTDAHSAKALGYAELGIGQARRAWLTKEQILNSRPLREIAKLPA
jgi:DNA polymerase (family 10)